MGLGNVFNTASSLAVSTFAKEKGKCQLVKRTSSYDTTSGEVTNAELIQDTLIAFVELDDKEVPNLTHREKHKKALISGKDINEHPEKNDTIIDQNSDVFLISRVKTDMYRALFTCYVKRVN